MTSRIWPAKIIVEGHEFNLKEFVYDKKQHLTAIDYDAPVIHKHLGFRVYDDVSFEQFVTFATGIIKDTLVREKIIIPPEREDRADL